MVCGCTAASWNNSDTTASTINGNPRARRTARASHTAWRIEMRSMNALKKKTAHGRLHRDSNSHYIVVGRFYTCFNTMNLVCRATDALGYRFGPSRRTCDERANDDRVQRAYTLDTMLQQEKNV